MNLQNIVHLEEGMILNRNQLLHRFVNFIFSHGVGVALLPQVKGDTADIFPPYMDTAFRIIFDDETESIAEMNPFPAIIKIK